MKRKKYLVFPGWVTSKTDGDQHFISGRELIRLYGANPAECVVVLSSRDVSGLDTEVMAELHPRYDGNYTLPTVR